MVGTRRKAGFALPSPAPPEDTPDDEQTVVTGEMHIVLDEVQLADLMAGNNDE